MMRRALVTAAVVLAPLAQIPEAFAEPALDLRPAPARARYLAPRSAASGAADRLRGDEAVRLRDGDVVARPLTFERAGAKYVGGVSYQLVRATPHEVLGALYNVAELPAVLPRTKSARLVSRQGRRAQVELTQGNALVTATYTVFLEPDGPGRVRFWMDKTRPHGVDDVWGYFRVEPFDGARSLVTVAAVVDLGPGLARLLFEDRVQNLVLTTPRHIRDYIEPRALAAR